MKTLSIVTVTYNARETLEKTLRSITLQSVFSEQVEFIVIDGGSTDGTLEIIEKYRSSIDRLISEPDHGIFDAMNKGARLTTAPWILFMNAGDEFYDRKTLESLHLKNEQPDHIIYGDCVRVWTDGHREMRLANPFFHHPSQITGIGICHQSTYTPTQLLLSHPFDWEHYPHCADFKLMFDLWHEECRFAYVPHPLCLYAYGDGFSSDIRHQNIVFDENARIMGLQYSRTYIKQRLHIAIRRLYSHIVSSWQS